MEVQKQSVNDCTSEKNVFVVFLCMFFITLTGDNAFLKYFCNDTNSNVVSMSIMYEVHIISTLFYTEMP